jgi:hypothetical protein
MPRYRASIRSIHELDVIDLDQPLASAQAASNIGHIPRRPFTFAPYGMLAAMLTKAAQEGPEPFTF